MINLRASMLISVLLIMGLLSNTASSALIEVQPFDNATSAAMAGWSSFGSAANGNNYGFSNSDFTGGASPAGEAGGVFARSGSASYYADLTIGGTLTRSQEIEAAGEFDITSISTSSTFNGSVLISHFDSSSPIPNVFAGLVGFNVLEETDNSVRVKAQVAFSDGTLLVGNELILTNLPDVDRLWSYSWDPTGGAFSRGQLTFSINGPGGGISSLDVGLAHDGMDFALDAFGMSTPIVMNPNQDETITLFIDDARYTSVVPLPATLWLFGSSLLGLIGITRRKSKRHITRT